MSQPSPLGIRATQAEFDSWRVAAEAGGMKRNRWIRKTLNEEAAIVIARADEQEMAEEQKRRLAAFKAKEPGKDTYEPDFK